MKILVTGFEPFGTDTENASWEAVRRLPDTVHGAQIIKKELPVSFGQVGRFLRELLEEVQPDAVLCVGQAAGRTGITPEKVAINWKFAAIADNDGILAEPSKIIPDGETAYFSTLPVENITAALQEAGIPAYTSYTAGTYVCNATMYELLHLLHSLSPNTPGGFIHVPYTSAQAAKNRQPSLPLETITEGLRIAVATMNKPVKKQPVNAGKPWTEIEIDKLLEEFNSNMTISAIAKEHGRTRGAIESKLNSMGLVKKFIFFKSRAKR